MTDEHEDGPRGPAEPTKPADSASDGTVDSAPDLAAEPIAAEAADSVADSAASDESPIPANETRRQRRKREKAAKPRRKAPWWELPVLVVVAVGIAILVKTFVIQPFYIPSESMEKTLHGCSGCSGDRILVNKPIYTVLRDPEPGDIVVFDAPKGWDTEPKSVPPSNPVLKAVRGFGQLIGFVPPDGEVLVKRVIAVGGQTVKGDAQGHVMVKDSTGPYRTLNEPFTYTRSDDPTKLFAFGPIAVPKGRLWVMGDHRTDSADSRFHCSFSGEDPDPGNGPCNPVSSTIPVDNVIGKAFVIAWPPSRWRTLGTPSTFESAADAAGPALPAVASLAVAAPVALVRRRRRR